MSTYNFKNHKINFLIFFILLFGTSIIIYFNNTKSRELLSFLFQKSSILNSSSIISNTNQSKWKKNKLVIIPAVFTEIDWYKPLTWPNWLRDGLGLSNSSRSPPYDVYLYQRLDANSKSPFNWPYCKNVHEEAGVYLKFIYDFYYDLPDKMLFIHAKPERHSLYPIESAQCIRDDVFYVSLNNIWFGNRPWIAPNPDPIDNITLMYKCAKRILSFFGFDGEAQLNPTNRKQKDLSVFSTMCCAQFYSEPYCTSPLDREIPGVPGVKSFGSGIEFLWHIILGLESSNMPIPTAKTNSDLCHSFRPSCFGTLCNAVFSRVISSPM
ncbi:hypothetical protein I4U23_004135 [Adineta vaga]|nr:hypothetical protein I4U23_004135 [Adineta vaga]